ncbi:MAG: hypothetical protein M3Q97_01855 [Bacteroidota bacterium]|nr:hypothetical protein [Bacteroidota bacterium]
MQNDIFRTFNIANFGIYNCGVPRMYPDGANIVTSLLHRDTREQVGLQAICLVEKGRNAIFSLWSGMEGKFPVQYNPRKENFLIGFTPEGYLALVRAEDFKPAPDKGYVAFPTTIVKAPFASIEDIRVFLDI